jgi:hypothetical protein
LLGLWTESDDQGIFEWKPITIKMRIMPVDNVDVPALLSELVRADVVKSFEQDGKTFGAVRNFCKYQRPKTPKFRPVSSRLISEITWPQPTQLPKLRYLSKSHFHKMEKCLRRGRREEGKGRRKGKFLFRPLRGRVRILKRSSGSIQQRKGDMGWKAAERKFTSLVKTGVDPRVIVASATRLAEQLRSKVGTEFIPRPEKWLASEDFVDVAVASFSAEPAVFDWDNVLELYKRTGHWSRWAGPDPESPACQAPRDLLEKHGLRTMQ